MHPNEHANKTYFPLMFPFDSPLERRTHLINCFQKQFNSAPMHPSLHYSSYYSEVPMASVVVSPHARVCVCVFWLNQRSRTSLE